MRCLLCAGALGVVGHYSLCPAFVIRPNQDGGWGVIRPCDAGIPMSGTERLFLLLIRASTVSCR